VALVDVVLGLLEVVADELERRSLVEVANREDRLEDALQPDVFALVWGRICLEELLVALLLNVDQVGDLDRLLDLGVALTGPEVVLKRRHF